MAGQVSGAKERQKWHCSDHGWYNADCNNCFNAEVDYASGYDSGERAGYQRGVEACALARIAMKVMIGRTTNTPWVDVQNYEVESWLATAKKLTEPCAHWQMGRGSERWDELLSAYRIIYFTKVTWRCAVNPKPLFKFTPKRLLGRRLLGMTIGIAAVSSYEKEIVLVTDSKISFGNTSADKAIMKNEPLIGRYAVLIAGNDAARAQVVIDRTRAHFPKMNVALPAEEVSEALFRECIKERDRIAEATVLRKHGFDWEQFRTQGKNICTDAVYYDIHSELTKVGLSLDFIVAGFDDKNRPNIRFTNWETPPEDYTGLGFYAIGSGAQTAIASLAYSVEHLDLQRWVESGEMLYHVLAAKFMAEAAQDVGKQTWAMAISADGHRNLSPFGAEEFIRKEWQRRGAPRVPKGIGQIIEELLYAGKSTELFQEDVLQRMAKYLPQAKELLRAAKKNRDELLKE